MLRNFPLKANMRTLTAFCDQYLNLMPPEIAVFRPAAPYVLLSAINYGRMSSTSPSFGWVAQNEVAFSVLLNRYRRVDGKLVFQDWASVSPFIFVDDESSLATGREVYGWPKSLAWLTPGINEWARHPEGSEDLLVLSSMVFPEVFAGQRQEPRVLLEIRREPTPDVVRLPPDLSNPLNPLLWFPKAMVESMSILGDIVQTVAALPIQGYPTDRNLGTIAGMMKRATDSLDVFRTLPTGHTVNLKQFRDAQDANAACYQAITTAPMAVARYNRGGLLGDMTQLSGDPSGGFRLRIHRYPSQPVIESLGLEVGTETAADDHSMATLKPVFPFWVDVDLNYGRGELICWRTARIGWRATRDSEQKTDPSTTTNKIPFNTARGAATEDVTGPFHFPNVTQRVLPLMANSAQLRRFCRQYLDNDFSFFEAWGPYVYLIVTTFEEMSSDTYNVGWWANRQVTFSFPVRWYKRTEDMERGELIGTAMLTPFAYTDSEMGATTGREVQGLPIIKASIESPENCWLEAGGPGKRSDLLRLSTNVFTAFHAGQEAREKVLLEITPRDILPSGDKPGWRKVAGDWGERLYRGLLERVAIRTQHRDLYDRLRALSLEVLRGGGQPINEVSLRQFPDVQDLGGACYQAITLTRTTIEELHELREIEQPMHVAIHRYPSQLVVDTLGLRVKSTDLGGGSVVDYLEPIRPFWMKLGMRVDLGEDVFWRAGSEQWQPNTPEWSQPRSELEGNPAWSKQCHPRDFYLVGGSPDVAPEVVRKIDGDEDSQQNLRNAWRFWRYPKGEEPTCISRQEAREAIGEDPRAGCIPPQVVIEGLLQHQWGPRPKRERSGESPPFFIPSHFIGNDEVRAEYCEKLGFKDSGDRLIHSGLEKELAATGRKGTT